MSDDAIQLAHQIEQAIDGDSCNLTADFARYVAQHLRDMASQMDIMDYDLRED